MGNLDRQRATVSVRETQLAGLTKVATGGAPTVPGLV